jgi:hypothetical protein
MSSVRAQELRKRAIGLVAKFNPNHDAEGKFTSGTGGSSAAGGSGGGSKGNGPNPDYAGGDSSAMRANHAKTKSWPDNMVRAAAARRGINTKQTPDKLRRAVAEHMTREGGSKLPDGERAARADDAILGPLRQEVGGDRGKMINHARRNYQHAELSISQMKTEIAEFRSDLKMGGSSRDHKAGMRERIKEHSENMKQYRANMKEAKAQLKALGSSL